MSFWIRHWGHYHYLCICKYKGRKWSWNKFLNSQLKERNYWLTEGDFLGEEQEKRGNNTLKSIVLVENSFFAIEIKTTGSNQCIFPSYMIHLNEIQISSSFYRHKVIGSIQCNMQLNWYASHLLYFVIFCNAICVFCDKGKPYFDNNLCSMY